MGSIYSHNPNPAPEKEFRRQWATTSQITWDKATEADLREKILQPRERANGKMIRPMILFFGPTGHGKSSLGNGFVSAVEDKRNVSSWFPVGTTSKSFTKKFHPKKIGNSWIIDMRGVLETKDITDESITKIASGKVGFYQELNEYMDVSDRENLPKPGKYDASCVVMILKLGAAVEENVARMFNCIMGLAGEGVVSFHLVLTHADECDDKFNDPTKLEEILDSRHIQESVMNLSERTGVAPRDISVVRNYVGECNPDMHSNILLLRTLDRIIDVACEQVLKKEQMEEMKRMNEGDDED